jgi:hypothetical protein
VTLTLNSTGWTWILLRMAVKHRRRNRAASKRHAWSAAQVLWRQAGGEAEPLDLEEVLLGMAANLHTQ